MLKNFQHYFRFYLASFLLLLLLIGIRWQAAPLGAAELVKEPAAPASAPAAAGGPAGAGPAAVYGAP